MTEKVFNDPIHGHIELPELCVSIIDTPQFQRLRYIKQLGGAYFVYPGASHNRFEHSIGVCHLAGELTKKLKNSQTDLNITDEDVLCLQIAGLCHDLGHGPFSHLFDKYFLPVFVGTKWKHETGSADMFDHMLEENPELKSKFMNPVNSLTERDITFIKELIVGSGREGRPQAKYFLYEIVNNARTGVDVDKWDYFARDCHHLGMKNAFDHNRLIKFARIATDEKGQKQLCTRDKEVLNLYDMFYTRTLLHRRAYQHKTTAIIEYMIAEALHKADEYIRIPVEPVLGRPMVGSQGVRMSETISKANMKAFTTLNDSIYLTILHSTSDELKPAREILERIERRQHYRYIDDYKAKSQDQTQLSADDMKKLIIKESRETLQSKLTENNIVVLEAMFSYGKKDQDPVKDFFVYSKKEPDTARNLNEDEVSKMLPAEFCESVLRLYCKDETDDVRQEAQECWNAVRRTLDGQNAN